MTAPGPRDARDLIETDVCIVGAGPAGIAIARELIGLPFRVCLLESGGFEDDVPAQELDIGAVDSRHFRSDALVNGRHRQFGGTTNLWLYDTEPRSGRRFARCLPPEPVDLEPREDPARNGWPVSLDALRPFYERAQATWNGGPYDYTVESWSDPATPPLALGGDVVTKMCQHGPSDVFSLRYRDDLLAADNVTVLTGSTAARLEWDGGGRSIRRVRVVRADGSTFAVSARAVILAGGGIENVQLLLLSDAERAGTGHGSEHLGRHIADHPEFRMGTIEPHDADIVRQLGLYDLRWVGRFIVGAYLTLSEERKRADGLLNLSAVLTPQPAGFGSPAHRSIASLFALTHGERPHHIARDARTIARAPREAVGIMRGRGSRYHEYRGGWSRPDVDPRRFATIEVHGSAEQTSDPDNRITLDDRRDRIGRRRARLRWRWSPTDQASTQRSIRAVADELEAAGVGRFSQWVEFEGPSRPVWDGIHHPMGGTRMHADPNLGVVDPDGRVHGSDNLYIAGSSVFPNGHGYANPTLTILALSIRLADHLKSTLG
jgi:choline dehydrogenase-like flavoprotein